MPVDIGGERSDQPLGFRIVDVSGGDVLTSCGGDDVPCFRENPVAHVAPDTVGNPEPASKTSVSCGSIVGGDMIPTEVERGEVDPFRYIWCVSCENLQAAAVPVLSTCPAHYLGFIN